MSTQGQIERFLAGEEARREAVRTNDAVRAYLVCARCGWSIREDEAKRAGVTACRQCGAKECRVTSLPYTYKGPGG